MNKITFLKNLNVAVVSVTDLLLMDIVMAVLYVQVVFNIHMISL